MGAQRLCCKAERSENQGFVAPKSSVDQCARPGLHGGRPVGHGPVEQTLGLGGGRQADECVHRPDPQKGAFVGQVPLYGRQNRMRRR